MPTIFKTFKVKDVKSKFQDGLEASASDNRTISKAIQKALGRKDAKITSYQDATGKGLRVDCKYKDDPELSAADIQAAAKKAGVV